MDMNGYALELLARDQLDRLRTTAAIHNELRAAAPPRPSLRVTLGLALIQLGNRALGSVPASPIAAPR
jgi:hypothetical protein